jgi:putative secretion ATPase (PEP-CTERM system associated)
MYESFYSLKDRPFQLTPSPQCFFASKLHKKALAYLQYGMSQGEGFIVITGDIGTGKTTIANQLLAKLDPQQVIARQIVTPKLEPDDLLRMICSIFQLNVRDLSKASYLEAISVFLLQLANQGKRALLLVDEAQNLPLASIEELRMLSNFQHNGRPLLQSFLLGQNELNAVIQSPHMEQFRQRIIASSNLSALAEEDCKAYIQYRLSNAGGNPELLADPCYPLIYGFSQGIPRKINTLMDRVLLFGFLEELQQIHPEHVNQVIGEIGGEVAQLQPVNNMQQQSNAVAVQPPEHNPYQAMLQELSGLIDSSLTDKLKMSQQLDQLLQQQQRAIDTQVKPKE